MQPFRTVAFTLRIYDFFKAADRCIAIYFFAFVLYNAFKGDVFAVQRRRQQYIFKLGQTQYAAAL